MVAHNILQAVGTNVFVLRQPCRTTAGGGARPARVTTAGPLSLVTTSALQFGHFLSIVPCSGADHMPLRLPVLLGLALATIAHSTTGIRGPDTERLGDVPAKDKL